MAVETVWRGSALLGEGPAWDAMRQALWFVDIKGRRVHRLDPASRATRCWDAPTEIGWVLPAQGGRMLAGLRTGLALFDPDDSGFTHLADVEPDRPGNRLNDAAVGPDGTLWFGTMDDTETAPCGRVFRWDGARVEPTTIAPVTITNGPGISPDGRTLYHVDTVGRAIFAVDVMDDGRTGTVRPFARIAPEDGHPDGATVDAAGNIWIGLWGGWRARLYSPEGRIVREVPLPAANITKLALGGPDLCTAYATSARIGLGDADLLSQPEAGAVFAFPVDVPGQCVPPVRLTAAADASAMPALA